MVHFPNHVWSADHVAFSNKVFQMPHLAASCLRWWSNYPWRIHGAGILMLTRLGYIDGIHVTIYTIHGSHGLGIFQKDEKTTIFVDTTRIPSAWLHRCCVTLASCNCCTWRRLTGNSGGLGRLVSSAAKFTSYRPPWLVQGSSHVWHWRVPAKWQHNSNIGFMLDNMIYQTTCLTKNYITMTAVLLVDGITVDISTSIYQLIANRD